MLHEAARKPPSPPGGDEVDALELQGVEEEVEGVSELGDGPVDRNLQGEDAVAERGDVDELRVERLGRADEEV